MTINPLVQRGIDRSIDRAALLGAVLGSVVIFVSLMTQRTTWQLVMFIAALCAIGFVRLDGQTLARWPRTVFRFATRSRWTGCRSDEESDLDRGVFRGPFVRHWAAAQFHGRLDLAGLSQSLWRDFEALLRQLAASETTTRLSLLELREAGRTNAWLCSDREITWPAPWEANATPKQLRLNENWYFEGWSYLRTKSLFQATLRVSSDSVEVGNFFQRISPSPSPWRVSLHLEVQPRNKALRRVRRASHATKSDDQFSRTLGFVSSAQREVERRNVFEREQLVVAGDALVQLAVLVTCQAESLDELRTMVQRATEHIRSTGARVERGYGRQLEWFQCAQMVAM